MVKLFFLTVLIFVFPLVNAQSTGSIEQKLKGLHSISDANHKRVELLTISSQIKEWWLVYDEIVNIATNTDLDLVTSSDKKMSVAIFGASTYSNIYQIEWLIRYNNKVWSFSEEIAYDINRGKPDLKYDLTFGNEALYGLRISSGKEVIVNASDLLTKCLFEDLQRLENDTNKDSINTIIQNRLLVLWSNPSLFKNDFSQLKRMKTLHSSDGKLKVCTYNVQKQDFKQEFFGVVIVNDNGLKVSLLSDYSDKIRSPERATLTHKKWYGALYLKLVENTSGNKTYYTLLGYKGHDEFVKTRVLDVMLIQNGRIRFGSPIFKTDRITRNRVIYQYSAGATMMMRYDAKLKMIVLDNLSPSDPMFRGVYQYYGPDFSYNGYKFSKGVWELNKDIDLRNQKK